MSITQKKRRKADYFAGKTPDDFLASLDIVGKVLVAGSKAQVPGSDRRRFYADAIGVDIEDGEGVDIVHDLERPLIYLKADHIDCYSVLEHIKRPWNLARTFEQCLNPKGSLFIVAPLVWRIHNYPGDYYRYTPDGIKALFEFIRFKYIRLVVDNRILPAKEKRVPAVHFNNVPHLARCEVVAYGVRY